MRLPLAAVLLLATGVAAAQPVRGARVGASVQAETLSGAYADGRSAVAFGVLPLRGGWVRAEAGAVSRLGESGAVASVAAGHDLGSRWLVVGSAATSTAGYALPRAQAAAAIGHKWGARRQIVTTVGAAFRDARDVHRDADLTAEVAVYGARALVQVGARVTRSDPGGVLGAGASVAATLGRPGGRTATARVGVQREAYLLVEPAPLDVAFRSAEASLAVEQPVGARWSVTARLSTYVNPYYQQVGLQTGLVHRF